MKTASEMTKKKKITHIFIHDIMRPAVRVLRRDFLKRKFMN